MLKKIKMLSNKVLTLIILELFIINQTPVNANAQADKNKGSKVNLIPDNYLSINTSIDKDNEIEAADDTNKVIDEYAPLKEKIAYLKTQQKSLNKEDKINPEYKAYDEIGNVVEGDRTVVLPDEDISIKYKEVKLDILKGSVKEEVEIVIEELGDVSELNPGMNNVTENVAGYRFLPDGMKFEKEIMVSLPYDKDKIDGEEELSTLYTYFYNEEVKRWERLNRVYIDREEGEITSLTTHFTDLINSTLKLPESPKPLSYNPNSIKDIKAANPASNIPELQGLDGGAFGSASFSLPLTVPPGRNGMAPKLSIDYNSDNANGWLGVGFDINVPCVTIDTKFGVPHYNSDDTYLLNGQELVSVGDDQYKPRIEGGFQKITKNDNTFEVISKDGTKSIYGGSSDSRIGKSADEIFIWYLDRVIDTYGNYIQYNYSEDGGNNYLYLSSIEYTLPASGLNDRYIIEFENDSEERKDCIINCRGRYKSKLSK